MSVSIHWKGSELSLFVIRIVIGRINTHTHKSIKKTVDEDDEDDDEKKNTHKTWEPYTKLIYIVLRNNK